MYRKVFNCLKCIFLVFSSLTLKSGSNDIKVVGVLTMFLWHLSKDQGPHF